MRWRNVLTAVGCAAALVLAGGSPVGAARPAGLREVRLGTGAAGWLVAWEYDINRSGEILGGLVDENDARRMGIWHRYAAPEIVDVPDNSIGQLTDKGEIVGGSWYWHEGTVTYVMHPTRSSVICGRNNRGEMAGTLRATPTQPSSAFLWRDGTFIDITAPQGLEIEATNLNERGDVLGSVYEPDVPSYAPRKAFVWRDGVTTIFDIPAAADPNMPGGFPRDINDRAQAIFNTSSGRPYLWDRGRMIDLLAGQPGRTGSVRDINNAGDVVGSSKHVPVMWHDGRMVPLRLPAGTGWWGEARAINDRGDVAGWLARHPADSATEVRAALWRDGRLLMSPGSTSEEISLYVVGVDDRGRIAGAVNDGAAGERQVVWIPES